MLELEIEEHRWAANFTFRKFHTVENWHNVLPSFFTGVKNWYQFFTFVKIEYQFTSEKNWTSFSQRTRIHTNSSQIKMRRMWNLSTDVWPPNYQNWPYANFTFSKSDVLVPILHTMWNLRNVKFAVQQSTKSYYMHTWVTVLSQLHVVGLETWIVIDPSSTP